MSDLRPAEPPTGELALAAAVARRYFLDDRTRVEIATELQLSRFKVARLLELARSSGLVRITIGSPGAVDTELSDRLRRRLGLRRAIVVNATDSDDAAVRRQLAELAAGLLAELLTAADVLGLGWSRAALETAARLRRPPACQVVQLTGALSGPDVTANLTDAVAGLAHRGGGAGYPFFAPMFVSDPGCVEVLTRQPEVAAAFARFPQVSTAVVGVGSWRPVGSDLHDALTAQERAELRAGDVLADICGTFLDSTGATIGMPLSRQIIGIAADQLRAVPDVICLAHGRHRAPAVRTAVRAGFVKTLVTTAAFAQDLLLHPTEG